MLKCFCIQPLKNTVLVDNKALDKTKKVSSRINLGTAVLF